MAHSATQSIGARAEQLALYHLENRGLRCLRRNFRCRLGEIDLIMRDGECLVFVEVRFRSRNSRVSAAHSIGPSKQRKIILAASVFLRTARQHANDIMRFDVVAIDGSRDKRYAIQWIKDAFRPN